MTPNPLTSNLSFMSKLIKKSSKKAGLPPGTLVHIGEKMTEKTRVAVVEYDGPGFPGKRAEDFETCYIFPKEPAVTLGQMWSESSRWRSWKSWATVSPSIPWPWKTF